MDAIFVSFLYIPSKLNNLNMIHIISQTRAWLGFSLNKFTQVENPVIKSNYIKTISRDTTCFLFDTKLEKN